MKNPLLPVALTFLLGICASAVIKPAGIFIYSAFISAFAAAVLFFMSIRKEKFTAALLMLLIFMSGLAWYQAFNTFPKDHIKYLVSEKPLFLKVEGRIVSNPVSSRNIPYFPEIDFLLEVKGVSGGGKWAKSSGLLQVKAYYEGNESYQYGDDVAINGYISAPTGFGLKNNFNYRIYLEHKRIYAVTRLGKDNQVEIISRPADIFSKLRRAVYNFKQGSMEFFSINIPPPSANVINAMVLGSRESFRKDIKEIFIKTGTMHIIAISGLHFGIITFVFLALFRMFGAPRKLANILTVFLLVLYACMAGGMASVWRSVIMASVFLFGFVINRKASLANLFSASLLVLLFINPNYIYDAGFILSYACVASIIWISPVIEPLFGIKYEMNSNIYRKTWMIIMKSIALSFSIWIGVFPVTAHIFKFVSPINVISNLVAVPISFGMIGLGMITIITRSAFGFFSVILSQALWALAELLMWSLKILSGLPFAFIEVKSFGAAKLFIYYAALFMFIAFSVGNNKRKIQNTRS